MERLKMDVEIEAVYDVALWSASKTAMRRHGVEPEMLVGTLQQTALRQGKGPLLTDDQLIALLIYSAASP